jgi:exosortase/archaeosortase family protein
MLEQVLDKTVKDKKAIKPIAFALKMLSAYGIWKAISFFLETYQPFFWIAIQDEVAYAMVRTSSFVLKRGLGYELIYNSRNVLIRNTEGIYMGNHCLGIPATIVFTLAILFFSGKWYHKLWYIPLGALAIFCINTSRIVALGITQKVGSPYAFYINHSYTFLILVYGLIFLMIMFWMDYFSKE